MKFRFTEERAKQISYNDIYGPADTKHLFTAIYEAGSEDYVTHLMDQPGSKFPGIMHSGFNGCDFVSKPIILVKRKNGN